MINGCLIVIFIVFFDVNKNGCNIDFEVLFLIFVDEYWDLLV